MASDESPRESAASGRFRLRRLWTPAAGMLLLIAGIVLMAQGPGSGIVSYAWVAYTPDGGSPGPALLISRSMQIGALLVLAGAVVLAFWGGLQAGRRRRPPAPPASSASRGGGQPG